MTEERCRCRDCRAGDALPDRLQGWPGAWQPRLIPAIMERRAAMPTIPKFEDDEKAREACRNRCAEAGDPPCWELNPGEGVRGGIDVRYDTPCAECLRDIGIEPGDEFDPNAAVRPLL